ncbi:uncharacterized protein C8A04DRAFT_35473 [Dichotomopilus funicola]|uniref:Uncharacterized protein n=1 Tax=Dichotomopilus funicola TaxID=1934379 RepID=A0AAN6V7K2_9PEZI|nr:hypothetical protein C8A04DRAFT_35473 [Dichotomopilus funicola]
MPTYLCHGFRWQRPSICIFVILQNLEDASPHWIISAKSSQCILNSFYEKFDFLPDCSPTSGSSTPTKGVDVDDDDDTVRSGPFLPANGPNNVKDRSQSRGRVRDRSRSQSTHQSRSHSDATQRRVSSPGTAGDDGSGITASSTAARDALAGQSWSAVKLLEEFDPNDLTAVSQPHAYVADYAIAKYEQQQAQNTRPALGKGWFENLRDELQREEQIRWYVVVNDDELESIAEQGAEDLRQEDQQHPPPQKQQQQVQYQPQPHRRTLSRKQNRHHEQYAHQQLMLEDESQEPHQPQQQRRLTFQRRLETKGKGQERQEQQRRRQARERKQQQKQELQRLVRKDRRLEKTQNIEDQGRLLDTRPPMPLGAPPPPPPPQINHLETSNEPPSTSNPRSTPVATSTTMRFPLMPEVAPPLPPPPLLPPPPPPPDEPPRPKVSVDALQPKAPGGKRGLRRLFSRSKFSAE